MEGGNNRQQLALMHRLLKSKKPNLKCPRCASMDTTFGYFNNYKVSQPRYFCLDCAKYWTQGGKIRATPNRPRTRKAPPPRVSVSSAGSASSVTHVSSPPQFAPSPVQPISLSSSTMHSFVPTFSPMPSICHPHLRLSYVWSGNHHVPGPYVASPPNQLRSHPRCNCPYVAVPSQPQSHSGSSSSVNSVTVAMPSRVIAEKDNEGDSN